MADATFDQWVILELMGHRMLAGHLTEEQIGGATFLRLDVPEAAGDQAATQYYRPESVYCITPVTEDLARAVAAGRRPAPVQRWELPALPAAAERDDDEGPDDDKDWNKPDEGPEDWQ